jgi:hypothetical protein
LKKLFKTIDADNGSTLDTIELSRFFHRIKPNRQKSVYPKQADNPCMHNRIRRRILNACAGKSKSHLSMLWREYDKDGSNTLNFSEFKDLMRSKLKLNNVDLPAIDLKMFFKYLDVNHNYTLEWDEFFTFVYGQMSEEDFSKVGMVPPSMLPAPTNTQPLVTLEVNRSNPERSYAVPGVEKEDELVHRWRPKFKSPGKTNIPVF